MSYCALHLVALSMALALLPACATDESGEGTGDEQFATASSGSFQLFVGEDGQHYFQLLAKNGERILRSQGYSSITAAKKGIASVKKNGKSASRFEVLEADNGEHYFNLTATNHQVLGTSETYGSKANANKGVEAVMRALDNPTSAPAESGDPYFETFKGADGKTYFRLVAKNGEIVLQSQGYSAKSSANGGIASVKKNAVDAAQFQIIGGVDGQHTFRLVAQNGQVIGRGEMYASKSGAIAGASRVRDIVRDMTESGAATDAQIEAEIIEASEGLFYMSESDYPFEVVIGDLNGPVSEALVRSELASYVDGDDDADKPMADLFAMNASWQEWKDDAHMCGDLEDPAGMELCAKMRNLEQVLEANLDDIQVFYFGAHGEPGHVDGIGVSIFIVGASPEGSLVGVRTLAIWT